MNPSDVDLRSLVLALAADVKAVHSKLDLLLAARAPRVQDHEAMENLVRAIYGYLECRPFSTADLLDASTLQAGHDLRDAIRLALGVGNERNGRKLGRLLRRAESVDLGGLVVLRLRDEGGTARWRIGVLGV